MIESVSGGVTPAAKVHVTVIVQVPFTGMLAEIQVVVSLKSVFVFDTEPNVKGAVPVFVIVTVCGGLVAPAASGAKIKFNGEMLANGPLIAVPGERHRLRAVAGIVSYVYLALNQTQ